jgi:ABC-type xylose transport system permease subunit
MQIGLAIIRLDLVFEIISGFIALIVTYYATKAYNLTGQKRLSDLSTGFLVLSAGMFGRVIGTWYFLIRFGMDFDAGELVISIVTIAYGVSRIMAYVLFVIATRPPRRHHQEVTGVSMLLLATFLVDSNLEVITILVLVVVVLQAILNYMSTRSRFARYVLVGFFLLLLSHIMMAQVASYPSFYLLSQASQLLGFLSFLVLLVQAGRVE